MCSHMVQSPILPRVLFSWNVGDVGKLDLVRSFASEVKFDQIRHDMRLSAENRRVGTMLTDPFLKHQPSIRPRLSPRPLVPNAA